MFFKKDNKKEKERQIQKENSKKIRIKSKLVCLLKQKVLLLLGKDIFEYFQEHRILGIINQILFLHEGIVLNIPHINIGILEEIIAFDSRLRKGLKEDMEKIYTTEEISFHVTNKFNILDNSIEIIFGIEVDDLN